MHSKRIQDALINAYLRIGQKSTKYVYAGPTLGSEPFELRRLKLCTTTRHECASFNVRVGTPTSICNVITCNSSSSFCRFKPSWLFFLFFFLLMSLLLLHLWPLPMTNTVFAHQRYSWSAATKKLSCVGPSMLGVFFPPLLSSSPDAGLWGFQQCVLPAWCWPPLRAKSDALSSTFDQQD